MPKIPMDDLDDLTATIEKLECLLTFSGYAIGAVDEKHLMAIILAMVRDYVQALRHLSTRLSEP